MFVIVFDVHSHLQCGGEMVVITPFARCRQRNCNGSVANPLVGTVLIYE